MSDMDHEHCGEQCLHIGTARWCSVCGGVRQGTGGAWLAPKPATVPPAPDLAEKLAAAEGERDALVATMREVVDFPFMHRDPARVLVAVVETLEEALGKLADE